MVFHLLVTAKDRSCDCIHYFQPESKIMTLPCSSSQFLLQKANNFLTFIKVLKNLREKIESYIKYIINQQYKKFTRHFSFQHFVTKSSISVVLVKIRAQQRRGKGSLKVKEVFLCWPSTVSTLAFPLFPLITIHRTNLNRVRHF